MNYGATAKAMEFTIEIIALGIFATAIIDIWATFSNKILKFPRTNWAMVGRWLSYLPKGQLIHRPISVAPEVKYEDFTGWLFHYLIGIIYALLYIGFMALVMNQEPSLISALLFGIVTLLSPWLIMQPCLGMGICASKATTPNKVRLQNLCIHSLFGVALYCGWLLNS